MINPRPSWDVILGNSLDILKGLPTDSIRVCVTSPPYWQLRDYGNEPEVWGGDQDCEHRWIKGASAPTKLQMSGNSNGHFRVYTNISKTWATAERAPTGMTCVECKAWLGQLGLEPTPQMFVRNLAAIFKELRRVLTDDGTLWLNLGDSYIGSGRGSGSTASKYMQKGSKGAFGLRADRSQRILKDGSCDETDCDLDHLPTFLPRKSLAGIPWRVAFALQDQGWVLRSDIVWAKINARILGFDPLFARLDAGMAGGNRKRGRDDHRNCNGETKA